MHLNLHSICQKFSRLFVYRPVKMYTTCISVVSKLLSSYLFCIQIQGIGDKGFMVDRSIYSWIIYIYTVFMIYKFITFIWMVGPEVLLFVVNLRRSLSVILDGHSFEYWEKNEFLGKRLEVLWFCDTELNCLLCTGGRMNSALSFFAFLG